jgi:hypothetical protein
MCGSVSAIGLEQHERELWPYLRERLREPGRLMALMRGVLGDTEVAAVVAVAPDGAVKPVGVLAFPDAIASEITLEPGGHADDRGVRPAKVGDYDVEVLMDERPHGTPRPLVILATSWIEEYLLLYARQLWRRR